MFTLIKSWNLKNLSKIFLSGSINFKRTQLFKSIAKLFFILSLAAATFFKLQRKVKEFL